MCTLHETSIINLALIYQDLGYLEQAKEYQQRSLAIRLGKLSPEHVDDGDGNENGKRA